MTEYLDYGKLAERAWKFAMYFMETDRTDVAMEWTGVAKVLEEISGKKDYGIIKTLREVEI